MSKVCLYFWCIIQKVWDDSLFLFFNSNMNIRMNRISRLGSRELSRIELQKIGKRKKVSRAICLVLRDALLGKMAR